MSLSIDRKLAGLSETPNYPFIFKVHQRLRKQNEDAYEPQMISIGPYHHDKENLKKMEKYKLEYLQGILQRQGEESAGRYIDELSKVEKEARDCYAEYISLSRDDFVEMMLLDGCFIIEFLRKTEGIVGVCDHEQIFSMGWYHAALCRDLLLFENQLPFFILEILFAMTTIVNCPEDELISLSISCLGGCFKAEPSYILNQPGNKTFHLLSLMHESWFSTFVEETDIQEEGGSQSICIEVKKWLCGKEQKAEDPNVMKFIKSVCELKEYGIEFEAKESTSCLDIKFENGIMKIPTLTFGDRTERILRNLIAYEQYITVFAGSSRMVVRLTTQPS